MIYSLRQWGDEIESISAMNGFYRCYTDEAHGFYFDLYKGKAISMDGVELLMDEDYYSALLSDISHGSETGKLINLLEYSNK